MTDARAPKPLHAITPAEARSRLAHPSNQSLQPNDPRYLENLYRLSGHQQSAEVLLFPSTPKNDPSDPLRHPLQGQPPIVHVAWAAALSATVATMAAMAAILLRALRRLAR